MVEAHSLPACQIHVWWLVTSHKKVFSMKTSTCRDGTLKNQPNKIGTTPQYFYTIPTSCAILPTMHCVCYLCAQKGCLGHGSLWNEQYWVCSARCCVWRVRCVVGGCNFVTVECGMQAWLASLICTSCGVQDQC